MNWDHFRQLTFSATVADRDKDLGNGGWIITSAKITKDHKDRARQTRCLGVREKRRNISWGQEKEAQYVSFEQSIHAAPEKKQLLLLINGNSSEASLENSVSTQDWKQSKVHITINHRTIMIWKGNYIIFALHLALVSFEKLVKLLTSTVRNLGRLI